ncbi:hypothetical protein Tco_0019966 [Tanacetum coccineum]
MSSSSTITYTSVYTDSEPGRPIAPPSLDYVPGPEHNPSSPNDRVLPAESLSTHLPAPVEVPYYLIRVPPNSDSDDDLEETPQGDHLTTLLKERGGHLAPADSSAIPFVDLVPSAGDTKAFETDEAAPILVPHLKAQRLVCCPDPDTYSVAIGRSETSRAERGPDIELGTLGRLARAIEELSTDDPRGMLRDKTRLANHRRVDVLIEDSQSARHYELTGTKGPQPRCRITVIASITGSQLTATLFPRFIATWINVATVALGQNHALFMLEIRLHVDDPRGPGWG